MFKPGPEGAHGIRNDTDEPIFWAELLAKGGHTEVGALIEQSLVGDTYLRNFRRACSANGIRIVAEEWIAQTAQDVEAALRKAESLGGTRTMGPARAPTGLVVGHFTDPEGNLIGVAGTA